MSLKVIINCKLLANQSKHEKEKKKDIDFRKSGKT